MLPQQPTTRASSGRHAEEPWKAPFFSIIVASYNRPSHLVQCLEAMARLEYPRQRFEVIVAVDGAGAPPESAYAKLRDSLRLTLFTTPRRGPAAARNAAAERAEGEYLAFTDDDCTPAADWLRKLAERLSTARDCAVGGRTVNVLRDRYATASQLLVDFLYSCYNPDPERANLVASNNLAVPLATFQALGGFDNSFTRPGAEDRDFCDRWLRGGRRIVFAPEVVVYHAHSMTLRTFWDQHFGYGCGARLYYRRRSWLQERPGGLGRLSFYVRLLTYPLRRQQLSHRASTTALFLLSQTATAAGYFWEEMRQDKRGA